MHAGGWHPMTWFVARFIRENTKGRFRTCLKAFKKKKKKIQDSARKWITYTAGEEERVVALELKKKALGI